MIRVAVWVLDNTSFEFEKKKHPTAVLNRPAVVLLLQRRQMPLQPISVPFKAVFKNR